MMVHKLFRKFNRSLLKCRRAQRASFETFALRELHSSGRAPLYTTKLKQLGLIIITLVCASLFSGCWNEQKVSQNPEAKKAEEVFGRWMNTQCVFHDRSLISMKDNVNEAYGLAVQKKYHDQAVLLKPLNELIESIFATDIKHEKLDVVVHDNLKKNLVYLYGLLENDLPGFIDFLRHHGLESNDVNTQDKAIDFHDVIKKYYGLMQLLFAHTDYIAETGYLFSSANRFFEFFFMPDTWKYGKAMLTDPALYPIARVFYATIWYYLSGHGWKHWNKACLDALKKEYDAGKKIVYIASGNDVYQLLRYGMYTIESIDPLLPSQPKFYADGWSWIVRENGIGDTIALTFDDTELELKRVEYRTYGTFKALLHTGLEEEVQKSKTRWGIYDKKTGKQLGNWIIHRRFATQDDFIMDKTKVLLVSFNELYFLTTVTPEKSWGIDPEKFQNDCTMYVKQLRRPVTKQVALNMQAADASEFGFIALGSQIN